MESRPFTVVGFPRSGTMYVARLLSGAGHYCVHEGYDPYDLYQVPKHTQNIVANMPGDWTKSWRYNYSPCVHLVRDPRDVNKSFHLISHRNQRILRTWFGEHDFEVLWVKFNEYVEKVFPKAVRIRVEDIPMRWEDLQNALELEYRPFEYSLFNVNTQKAHSRYGFRIFEPNYLINTKMEEYGYA